MGFMKATSYTPRLIQYLQYYKTFSNILRIRTISAEYLVVMKLIAGRQYKNDLSDIIGILLEQQNAEKEISLDSIKRAAGELYDRYENLPESSRTFLEAVYQNPDLSALYEKIREDEKQNKDILLDFQNDYLGVPNGDSLAEILKATKVKRKIRIFPSPFVADISQ